MRKKILVISLFAVFMLVILPISAVVGTHNVKTNLHNNKIYSPLFANRIDNVLSKKSKTMNTEYIGKSTFLQNLKHHSTAGLTRQLDWLIKIPICYLQF